MRRILVFAFLFMISTSYGQAVTPVAVYDFIKIKNGKNKEAMYYYENNWKFYRDIAIKKNFITAYKMVTCQPDSLAGFNLILITEYADSTAYSKSEERFSEIIKETRPNGPLLLNEIKPQDFRDNLFFRKAETIISSKN
jgi:hypothetical protein